MPQLSFDAFACRPQKKTSPDGLVLEQGTGVEPASEAWEATIIADILTLRDGMHYSTAIRKMQAEFSDRVRPITPLRRNAGLSTISPTGQRGWE